MKNLQAYIIEESLKDKIKSWIEKFKKKREPEKIFTEEDLNEFKNKTITEEDADKIIEIRQKIEDGKKSDYLFGSGTDDTTTLRKNAYKQAILDYAYLNFKGQLKTDSFGENHADRAFYKACKDNGEDSTEIRAGYYGLPIFGRYFYGWGCAEKLNLKCETEIKVNFKL